MPEFSSNYVPKSSLEVFPAFLKSLHKSSYLDLKYNELLEVCETVFESLTVTVEMAESVEKETRAQAKSNLWFKHRAGRITSSLMKAVCHTDPTNPAQSLVKSICNPLEFSFSSKETEWGQKQEKTARDLYFKKQKLCHKELTIIDSGLVINSQWPFHQMVLSIVHAVRGKRGSWKSNVPILVVLKKSRNLSLMMVVLLKRRSRLTTP